MTTTLIPLSNNSNRFVVILLKTDEKKKCEENCSCCGVNCEFPHFRF